LSLGSIPGDSTKNPKINDFRVFSCLNPSKIKA
jgi:hypothetical protein